MLFGFPIELAILFQLYVHGFPHHHSNEDLSEKKLATSKISYLQLDRIVRSSADENFLCAGYSAWVSHMKKQHSLIKLPWVGWAWRKYILDWESCFKPVGIVLVDCAGIRPRQSPISTSWEKDENLMWVTRWKITCGPETAFLDHLFDSTSFGGHADTSVVLSCNGDKWHS